MITPFLQFWQMDYFQLNVTTFGVSADILSVQFCQYLKKNGEQT